MLDPTPSSSLVAEEHSEDQAKIVDAELGEDEFDQNLLEAGGSLRIRPDISLEDGVYAGKRSSRKDLFEDRDDDEDQESFDESDDAEDGEDEDEARGDDVEDGSEDESDDSDQADRKTLKRKSSLTRSREDEEADRFELVAMEEAEQLQKQLDQMLSEQKSVVTQLVREEENEQEKAKHTYNQVKLWDTFLDLRIKQQKLLTIANRFPQVEYHSAFCKIDPQIKKKFDGVSTTLRSLISSFIGLQQELVGQNPDLEDVSIEKVDDDLWKAIEETQQKFRPFEAEVIEKWSEKAQISSGKFANKSLKAINQGILSQVNQLLENKDRLLKRTQLNRSKNRILGKRQRDEEDGQIEPKKAKSSMSGQEEYDEELYDDTDFYQELLKDLIDTTKTSDPIALGKKWLELKETQTKKRKDVDRRASKGRKIRYHVHEKLVSFMPPVPEKEAPFMVEDLFAHLFGGSSIKA